MAWLKRISLLLLLSLALCQGIRCQGMRYDNFVLKPLNTGGLTAVSGALITVCTSAGTGTPCTPKVANIYSDEALTTPITGTGGAGTTNSDSGGNFGFYLAPGSYIVTVTGSGITSYTIKVILPVGVATTNAFTGISTFGNINNDLWVDGTKYATCAAAVTAAGTVNQTLLFIPTGHSAIDCPAGAIGGATAGGQSNIIINNHAKNDWCNPAYHANVAPCSAINYGYDDGNVATVEKHQSEFTTTNSNGADLGLYALSWLVNGTAPASGGQLDGFSGEANTWGTLSGTFARLVAHEADDTVYSTGGTVTNIDAIEGYVNTNSALSGCTPATTCTQVTNTIGGHFWGARTIGGARPTNNYGVKIEDSASLATADNYALYAVGKSLLGYSSSTNVAQLQLEDHTNARHAVLTNDSSDNLLINATSSGGIFLEDSAAANHLRIASDGVHLFTSFWPNTNVGAGLGKSTNGFSFLDLGETTVPTAAAGQDVCYGDSTAHAIECSYNNGSFGLVPLTTTINSFTGNTVALTADWTCGTAGTVSSCVAATIIGSGGGVPLTFTLPLFARSYTLECDGVVGQATAVTANQWNILTATNGATNVTANYTMATAATAFAAGAITDQASTTTTFNIAPAWTLGAISTKMPFHIWAKIEGASASGTVVSLQLVAPTVADLVTIYRGASCRIF